MVDQDNDNDSRRDEKEENDYESNHHQAVQLNQTSDGPNHHGTTNGTSNGTNGHVKSTPPSMVANGNKHKVHPVSNGINGVTTKPDKKDKWHEKSLVLTYINDFFHGQGPYFPAAWLAEFSHRPSWCDAKMSLQQVNRGKAVGFKPALHFRSVLQMMLFYLGRTIQHFWPIVIIVTTALLFIFCSGLRNVVIQIDIVKLWVEDNGDLNNELTYLSNIAAEFDRKNKRAGLNITTTTTAMPTTTIAAINATIKQIEDETFVGPKENPGTNINGGFTLFIQTPKKFGDNVLTNDDLTLHADLLVNISKLGIEWGGHNWTLTDLCFKPPSPKMGGQFAAAAQPIIDSIIPCVFITPLDCFWDGSRPMGPDPPIEIPAFLGTIIPNLPTGLLTWRNLNPDQMFDAVKAFMGDLGVIGAQLDRAGMYDGYLSRPCIDNLHPECPTTAPNAVDYCEIISRWRLWSDKAPKDQLTDMEKETVPKSRSEVPGANKQRRQTSYDDYENYEDLYNSGKWAEENEVTSDKGDDYADDWLGDLFSGSSDEALSDDPRPQACREYVKSVNKNLRANPRWLEKFIDDKEVRKRLYPMADSSYYGSILEGGCDGFAKNILGWPEALIIGGQKYKNGSMVHAEAFQTVMLLGGAGDIYNRYKDGFGYKQDLKNNPDWSPEVAGQLLADWQRMFTKYIFEHVNNTDGIDDRQSHPLAGTSISDMMAEFSKFNFAVIIIGYLLMFLYAGFALFSFGHRGVDSCAGLAFTGVILVTIASAAGLGVSTMMGIEFNAVTTQIVPFLALGLGVDDMFLLVENYMDIVRICHHDELGFLLKETGLSVLLTSISNIVAFLAGSSLPIPAMRSFCLQTAILLFFNVCFVLTLYPAIMAIDLLRRKHTLIDIFCCFKGRKATPSPSALTTKGHSRAASDALPRDGQYHKLPPNSSTSHLQGNINPAATNADEQNGNGNTARQPTGHSPPPPYDQTVDPRSIKINKVEHPHDKESDTCDLSLHHFVKKYYIPFLTWMPVKVAVLVISLAMIGLGVWGTTELDLGLELSDVIPKGTAEYDFLVAREKYFSFYPMYGVVRAPTDFPRKQVEMQQFRNEILDIKYTVTGNSALAEKYWYSIFRGWLEDLQGEIKVLRSEKLATSKFIDVDKLNEKQVLAYALTCSVGNIVNCSRFDDVDLVYLDKASGELVVQEDAFYNYLTAWYRSETMMYYVSQANFFPEPKEWAFVKIMPNQTYLIPASDPLQYTQIPFFLNDLINTPPIVEMIKEVRAICTRYTDDHGLTTFPTGIPFMFWHQYLNMKTNLLKALAIVSFAVFVVISILLMNPWTGMCVLTVLLINLVELAGFMGLAGLKLNPVSAVTLIVAVGIGVEFTVHVSLSYLTTLGTVNERIAGTLNHMFVPVIHGGISTFLGIIMLVFSEFEFIIRYFFVVMVALVLLGIWNGLALLPVVLAFFGPPSEVRPKDGGNYLEPPPLPQDDMQVAMMENGHGKWLEVKQAANGSSNRSQAI